MIDHRLFRGVVLWAILGVLQTFNLLKAATQIIQPGHDYEKILEMASPHDTIQFQSGTYRLENLVIDKPLTLLGAPNSWIESEHGDQILVIRADSVSIIALNFRGVKANHLKESAAIRIKKAGYFQIRNNRIEDCFFGIYLERATYGIVDGNVILGAAETEAVSGNAIHAWYCHHLEITGNQVSGHRDGIYFEFVDQSEIERNTSWENVRYGLHFMFSNQDTYSQNTFTNNGVGVAVMFSKDIRMIANEFSHNWGNSAYGLLLKEMNDALITNNIFRKNTLGIFVEGSNRVQYEGNRFVENGWAVKLSGGCSANVVQGNDFLHNTLDLVVNSQLLDNKFSQNYWSEYSGYDLDRDGIGDIPHYPVKLFSYILNQVPEAIVLMRSLFVDVMNFAEKVSPVFTPKEVFDPKPLMQPIE